MPETPLPLDPVLVAIDNLIAQIRDSHPVAPDAKKRKTRTLNFLEAIRAALVAWCTPAPDDYYYYEYTGQYGQQG